jgi:hypothetical protein
VRIYNRALSADEIEQNYEALIPVADVSLNKAVLFLEEGEGETLTATIEPDNATNTDVMWVSDNEDVATVDNNGNVSAVAKGAAKITATTVFGNKKAFCWVNVVAPNSLTPVLDDCVLYLDGREGTYDPVTNTWYDLSGKGNHGTLTNFDFDIEGSNVWTEQGLKFDGEDGYVFIDDCRPVLNEFTLETTFTPYTTAETFQTLFSYRKAANGTRIGLFLSKNKIYWEISSDNRVGNLVEELSDFTVENNNTYTVFIKKEANGNTFLVVDGVKYELGLCAGSFTDFDTNMQIGKHLNNDEQYANCAFKTVRFYTRALTDLEIMQNYLATQNPEPSPVEGAVLELDGAQEAIGSRVDE